MADLNGDHKPDLVIADNALYGRGGSVSVFLGNGDGTFQPEQLMFTSGTDTVSVPAMADLNGDGMTDLAFTVTPSFSSFSSLAIALGNGKGTFAAPVMYPALGSSSLAIGDVNGDGVPDIVTNGVSIFLGDGAGHFPKRLDYAVENNAYVSLADVDGDGRIDIVAGTAGVGNPLVLSNVDHILFGRNNGTFFGPPVTLIPGYGVPFGGNGVGFAGTNNIPVALMNADFNGDGIPDLAFASTNVLTIFKGVGDGTFSPSFQHGFLDGAYPVQGASIGDFNGDGKPDVAVSIGYGNPGMIEVFLGLGDGTFQPPLTTGAPAGVSGLVVGDFNGDGKLDLAVDYRSPDGKTGSILIYLGKGDGTFASSVSYPTSPQTGSVVTRDLNGDGRLDLAFIQEGSSSTPNATLNILLGKGDGTFSAGPTTPLPPAYSAFGSLNVADFNGDGKLDLAFGVAPSGPGAPPLSSTLVLLGRGDGSFQAPGVYPVATEAAADMNGDHIPDLVAYDPATGYLCYLPGHGDGTFLPEVTLVAVTPGLLVVADFNTDGRLDLADISSAAGYDSVLYSGSRPSIRSSPSRAEKLSPNRLIWSLPRARCI